MLNVKALVLAVRRYPPVLITVGQMDSRVDWWGPVKYGWRIRRCQEGSEPVYLQWDMGSHFNDDADERAVQLAFMLASLRQ